MKILILTNLGFRKSVQKIANYLKQEGHEVSIFFKKINAQIISSQNLDLIISHNYGFIINQDVISLMDGNIINMHPSYLPHCRGLHPYIWGPLTKVPLGVTIHFINNKIDKGDIIAQKYVDIDYKKESLRTGYQILQKELEDLFIEEWPKYDLWKKQAFPPQEQGSYYSKEDYNKIVPFIKTWDILIEDFVKTIDNNHY